MPRVAYGRDAHGDLLSLLEPWLCWSWALTGAELGPQAPLIQVLTPRRGKTDTWRTIQTTRTPKRMRNSIVLPPVFAFSVFVSIICTILILRYLWAKKSAAPEASLDASHEVGQMRLGDLVVRLAPVLLALEQAAALHEPQVFGGHVAGDAARLGQFADHVAAPQEHLDHAQPVRVGQRLEAFRRLLQRLQGRKLGQLRGLGCGG